MTITNPSFEDAGTLPGEADGWTSTSTSSLSEPAVIDAALGASKSNKGIENFEAKWRKRYSPKDLSGNPADPDDWGHYDHSGGFTSRGDVPGGGYIVGLAFVIEETLAATSDITVTVQYTPAGGGSETEDTVLPNGALATREYPVVLYVGEDIGAEEITDISVAPAMTAGSFYIVGGLALSPYNEDYKPAFSDTPGADLFPASFIGANVERFEAGWDNDAGFKDDFDSLLSEYADMDGLPTDGGIDFEAFENDWVLPATHTPPPANEDRIIAFHPFIASANLGDEVIITTDLNDKLRFEYTAGGTTTILSAVVAPGTYTIAQLAAAIETTVDAALDADSGGSADNTSFDAYAVVGQVYLENKLAGSALILRAPAGDSLWEEIGITPGINTTRYIESDQLAAASFDTIGTPEAVEDFEEYWRSNENYKSAFTVDMPPPETELEFADMDGLPADGGVDEEDFESGWTTML